MRMKEIKNIPIDSKVQILRLNTPVAESVASYSLIAAASLRAVLVMVYGG